MTSPSISRLDVERIRVPAERVAAAQLARLEPHARDGYRAPGAASLRREVLANALLLTDTMAPKAYEAAHAAMSALMVDDRIELYQANSRGGVDTARLAVPGDPIGVELIGNTLGVLDHDALIALFGHEIGHAVAHLLNPEHAWVLELAQDAVTPTRKLYSLAAELTADRFGLLACKSLDAALRLEMHVTAGSASVHLTLDTAAYLAQCRVIAEQTLAAGKAMGGTTHPEHYIRGYAEWLFSETDCYRAITGKGPSSMSLDEANAQLSKLLRIEVVAPAFVAPRPPATSEPAPTSAGTGSVREGMRKILGALPSLPSARSGWVPPSIKAYATAAFGKDDGAAAPHLDENGDLDASIPDDPLAEDDKELLARFEGLDDQDKT